MKTTEGELSTGFRAAAEDMRSFAAELRADVIAHVRRHRRALPWRKVAPCELCAATSESADCWDEVADITEARAGAPVGRAIPTAAHEAKSRQNASHRRLAAARRAAPR